MCRLSSYEAGEEVSGLRLGRACGCRERVSMGDVPLISVVDDDESVRESLPDLLGELGFAARAFPSAEGFLASGYVDQTRCLVLDVDMPGMSGPDLRLELQRRQKKVPIIFITGHGNEMVRQLALENNTVQCLFKPFSDSDLLQALNLALRAS
jgi:FixJ family two-component response regulator